MGFESSSLLLHCAPSGAPPKLFLHKSSIVFNLDLCNCTGVDIIAFSLSKSRSSLLAVTNSGLHSSSKLKCNLNGTKVEVNVVSDHYTWKYLSTFGSLNSIKIPIPLIYASFTAVPFH